MPSTNFDRVKARTFADVLRADGKSEDEDEAKEIMTAIRQNNGTGKMQQAIAGGMLNVAFLIMLQASFRGPLQTLAVAPWLPDVKSVKFKWLKPVSSFKITVFDRWLAKWKSLVHPVSGAVLTYAQQGQVLVFATLSRAILLPLLKSKHDHVADFADWQRVAADYWITTNDDDDAGAGDDLLDYVKSLPVKNNKLKAKMKAFLENLLPAPAEDPAPVLTITDEAAVEAHEAEDPAVEAHDPDVAVEAHDPAPVDPAVEAHAEDPADPAVEAHADEAELEIPVKAQSTEATREAENEDEAAVEAENEDEAAGEAENENERSVKVVVHTSDEEVDHGMIPLTMCLLILFGALKAGKWAIMTAFDELSNCTIINF